MVGGAVVSGLPSPILDTPVPPSPEVIRKVSLLACEAATDLDDARFLLRALGLIPDPGSKGLSESSRRKLQSAGIIHKKEAS